MTSPTNPHLDDLLRSLARMRSRAGEMHRAIGELLGRHLELEIAMGLILKSAFLPRRMFDVDDFEGVVLMHLSFGRRLQAVKALARIEGFEAESKAVLAECRELNEFRDMVAHASLRLERGNRDNNDAEWPFVAKRPGRPDKEISVEEVSEMATRTLDASARLLEAFRPIIEARNERFDLGWQ